jgi:hypothetical protein
MTNDTTTVAPNAAMTIEPEKPAQLATTNDKNVLMSFADSQGFALAQRVAAAFSQSSLVPEVYRKNLPNCLIALNMAQRLGADPLMVMQNLYIVHGRPAWSSAFLISCFNQCGRFSSMRFEWRGKQGQKDWACRAYATERKTGDRIDGSWITWSMVDAEGWSKRNGSKWTTMPEQMFMYRAASFFTRAYAPELTMGLHTAEEVSDIVEIEAITSSPAQPQTIAELKAAARAEPAKPEPFEATEDDEIGAACDPEPSSADPEPTGVDRKAALAALLAAANTSEKAVLEIEGACAEADVRKPADLPDEQLENLRLKVAALRESKS